jgi:argininosuccinate lyase
MAPSLEVNVSTTRQSDGKVQKTAESFSTGRLSKLMSPLLQEWNETPRLQTELKNLSTVLQVDRAHVVMLAEQKIIDTKQACALLTELRNIDKAGPEAFRTEPGFGSIVLQIEQELTKRLGEDTAGRLPIARSRLDQGTTVRRMTDRNAILMVSSELQALQVTLIKEAERHRHVNMIHYTHLQQAQPANFGHWLLAFRDRLQDSVLGLQRAYCQTDRSPLGAVGLAGTDIPIDRLRTAELLGFSSVLENSRLGRDAYDQIVITFELAMIMGVLNDLCTDLHIFSSNEFRTVESDDSHCQTSSVFPHKKNPYGLEAVKINAAYTQGWMATAFALFRNEGTADHSSRNIGLLSEAYRVTQGMLRLTTEILESLTVHEQRWEELLNQAWVTTNRLGNILLTKHGMSYRTAHSVVARLVKIAISLGLDKATVNVDVLHQAADEMGVARIHMTDSELRESLDHNDFIENSQSLGSVGPDQVTWLLGKAWSEQQLNQSWIQDKQETLAKALNMLQEAEQSLEDDYSGN